jgi:hypothetical protein
MKTLFVLACALLVPGGVSAQTREWEPSAGHTQMPIWPGAAPDLQPAAGSGACRDGDRADSRQAGTVR